jgi:hypothetical protein
LNGERGVQTRRLTRRKKEIRFCMMMAHCPLLVFAAGRRIFSGDSQSGVLTTTDTMDELF